MKAMVLAALLLGVGTAQAATPLEDYLGKRDRLVAALNKPGNEDTLGERDMRALRELEILLVAMIRPMAVKGFPPEGRIALDTLIQEIGFGRLDGLVFGDAEGASAAYVTTRPLLRAWLKEHEAWLPEERMPQNEPDALRWEGFYTQAIATDAEVVRYTELPVNRPPGVDLAYAMLAASRQDLGGWEPDQLVVAAIKGERVYILVQPAAAKAITACRRSYPKAESNEKQEAAYRRCYEREAENQPWFPAIVGHAQGLLDGLP